MLARQLSVRRGTNSVLSAHDPRGAFREVTSVPDIRIQAAEVAEVADIIAYSVG